MPRRDDPVGEHAAAFAAQGGNQDRDRSFGRVFVFMRLSFMRL